MKTMLRLGRERDSLGVVFDQIGTPTYAADLAAAIFTAIGQGIVPGIYHFSNEGVCSWYDFAHAIHRLAGITTCKVSPPHRRISRPRAPRIIPYWTRQSWKQTLGIDIPHWEKSLAQCIRRLEEQ